MRVCFCDEFRAMQPWTVNRTQMKAYRSDTWRIKSHIHRRLEGYQGRGLAALPHSGSRSDLGSVVHGCITAEFPCGVSPSCYRCFTEYEKKKTLSLGRKYQHIYDYFCLSLSLSAWQEHSKMQMNFILLSLGQNSGADTSRNHSEGCMRKSGVYTSRHILGNISPPSLSNQ